MIGYGFMGRAHSNAIGRRQQLLRPASTSRCSRPSARAMRGRRKAFADKWGYASIETDWRKLVEREGHRRDRHLHAQQLAPRHRHRRRQGRQDDPLRKAAVDEHGRRARRWSTAVEKAGVPNTVWYNYRRVPAVTLAKQLIDEGRLGRIFHYRANFLQDWTISADLPQGGAGLVAARRQRRRQRRHRRPAGPLHRHGPLAQRPDHRASRR